MFGYLIIIILCNVFVQSSSNSGENNLSPDFIQLEVKNIFPEKNDTIEQIINDLIPLEESLLQLPVLDTILKVSPRTIDTNNTIVKLELETKEIGQGRIFFKKINFSDPFSVISQFFLWSNIGRIVWSIGKTLVSFIGKFISERLIFALLAILLVVKLIAVKVLFILPSLIGVVTAKKLIVKVLLFLFPFLHHLFKLCAVTPYGAKHHIHKHQIAHIHQVAPGHHHHGSPSHHYLPPYHEGHPGHHFSHKDDPGNDLHPSAAEYENDACRVYIQTMGLRIFRHVIDIILNFIRTAKDTVYKEPETDENDVSFWGFGLTPTKPKEEAKKPHFSPVELENMVLKAEKEALIKSRLQKERQRIHEENLRLQDQLNNALKIQHKLKHGIMGHKIKPVKRKHNHFGPPLVPSLTPLLPPPLARPPIYFDEPPLQDFGDSHLQVPESGPFAEPPSTFMENQGHIDELPHGVIGGGLPASTVDAVQNYLTQKTVQNSPIYKHNQNEENQQFFVTPQHVTIESVQAGPSFQPTIVSSPTNNRKSDTFNEDDDFYRAAQITYDKFYSPILEKIDAVLNELEFIEEPCKERLICSMYKNPQKFSPHSNLVSMELSRDSKDLQKPTSTNAAVIRFYKYVQAARDGQDQRDCIRLYPTCAINTET